MSRQASKRRSHRPTSRPRPTTPPGAESSPSDDTPPAALRGDLVGLMAYILVPAVGILVMLAYPWFRLTSQGTAVLALGFVLLGSLLVAIAGGRVAMAAVPVVGVLIAMALGWWTGDQFDWTSGELRSAGESGSGLYPEFEAIMLGVVATIGSVIGWIIGRSLRPDPTGPGA